MKVNRQGLTENYKTTSEWVFEFEKNLEKKADYLDNLKTIIRDRNSFSTIEEKMADIRSRAGFELIKDIDSADISKKASNCGCESGSCGCGGCSCGKYNCKACNSDLIKEVCSVIKYITDYCSNNPGSSLASVLNHCRNNNELNFHNLENRLDGEKFRGYIVDKIIKPNNDFEKEEVKYIPVSGDDLANMHGDEADYFAHAKPSS